MASAGPPHKVSVPRYSGRPAPDLPSSASLDIKDILAQNPCESLLSLSPILPSISDDSLSFDDVPPFPSDARPPLYVNVVDSPTLKSVPPVNKSTSGNTYRVTTTIPTGPRLKLMLLEPICIQGWMNKVPAIPAPGHVPWQEGDYDEDETFRFPSLPWKPEGSMFSREEFKERLAKLHPERQRRTQDTQDAMHNYRSPLSPTELTVRGEQSTRQLDVQDSTAHHSIHILDSSGLDASGSVSKVEVPTIMISSSTAIIPFSLESSQSLMRVPLAVRRGQKVPATLALNKTSSTSEDDPYPDIPSPFLGSPSASTPTFEFTSNTSASSLGLEAMCADLRQRCPDLRSPSPQETPEQPNRHAHIFAASLSSTSDPEDEWQFAQDLLNMYGDKVPPSLDDDTLQSSPSSQMRDREELSSSDVESFSWAMSPTLTNSDDQTLVSPLSHDLRQMRRKTVIIETPTHAKVLPSDSDTPPPVGDFDKHQPVPFESPSSNSFSCTQCQQSTPVQSRPSSSASMRPVKGILKEKKSVRFSIIPSRHEYPSEEHDSDNHSHLSEPVSRSAMSPRLGSPLRQSFSPDASGLSNDSATRPDDSEPASRPKHPALRSIIRSVDRPVSPQTPTVTPAILADQQRAPLRSLNTRQSLPAKRNSNAVYVDQSARKRRTTDEVGRPKRLMKTVSTSYATTGRNENASVRESALQKTRMPVPFRSILTKLRA